MCVDSFDHNFYYINNYIKARKLELVITELATIVKVQDVKKV